MRSDTVFKLSLNRTLDCLEKNPDFPLTEHALARSFGISRTTSRKVLGALAVCGIARRGPAGWALARPPTAADRFPQVETTSRIMHVERRFMEWMLRADTRPGTQISELELSRQFGVATGPIREFLIRFSRFGLVEKKPNSGWLFRGVTTDFALELFEVRVLFELRSVALFLGLPDDAPHWQALATLRSGHQRLLSEIDSRYHDFSDLDDRFHRLIASARPNRFITDFHGIIAMIFHYHYQWNKKSERTRNAAAIAEHLDLIAALERRDPAAAESCCRTHLNSARATLLESL